MTDLLACLLTFLTCWQVWKVPSSSPCPTVDQSRQRLLRHLATLSPLGWYFDANLLHYFNKYRPPEYAESRAPLRRTHVSNLIWLI